MTKIIGISGISGSGKTTLTKKLSSMLNATALFWDDYDEISAGPSDYVKWYNTSNDCNDWHYDALADTLKILKAGKDLTCPATKRTLISTSYIVFDAPLGYEHLATGHYIDFLVFIDTPLDVALARRIIRDYYDKPQISIHEILEELDYYLTASRPVYASTYQTKYKSDLILDGNLSTDEQVQLIRSKLKSSKTN